MPKRLVTSLLIGTGFYQCCSGAASIYKQISHNRKMGESGNLSWVWDERFWFPPDRPWGWKDLENAPESNVYLPQVKDLHWSILLGVALIGVRYLLEM